MQNCSVDKISIRPHRDGLSGTALHSDQIDPLNCGISTDFKFGNDLWCTVRRLQLVVVRLANEHVSKLAEAEAAHLHGCLPQVKPQNYESFYLYIHAASVRQRSLGPKRIRPLLACREL